MDRLYVLLLLLISCSPNAVSQYFQQKVDYEIIANVDDDLKTVTVNGNINYLNTSSESLDTIFFHLWANAFSGDGSAFSDQLLKLRNTKFYFDHDSIKGGYETMAIGEGIGIFKMHDFHPDMGYLVLEETLDPSSAVTIPFEYKLKLPFRYSRLGYRDDYLQLSYWYPKPAVYDENGWHWFPYLNIGEFYSDYGSYDVLMNVPQGVEVVGTGSIMSESMSSGKKQFRFMADHVIDAAFVLSRSYEVEEVVKQGRNTELKLRIFYKPGNDLWRSNALKYMIESLTFYEKTIGEYPYPVLTCVQDPSGGDGGMEYPMLITVGARNKKTLDYYINHEVGHQWFYGVLGFNERQAPYLDEGLTTYYEHRYTVPRQGTDYHTSNSPDGLVRDLETPILQQVYLWQKRRAFSESPSKSPIKSSIINYGVNSYERAAYVFGYLADYLGEDIFDRGISKFFQSWKFKHPDLDALVDVLEDESNRELSWVKQLLTDDVTVDFEVTHSDSASSILNNGNVAMPVKVTKGSEKNWHEPIKPGEKITLSKDVSSVNEDFIGLELDGSNNHKHSSLSVIPLFSIDHSRKKELYYSLLGSWNKGDGWGLGPVFYNSTFPSKKFQYLLAPQYGFSSGELIGNGWLAYNRYSEDGPFRKIQYKLSGKRYTYHQNDELDYRTQYSRITPQLSFHFMVPPASQIYKKITLRSIWLHEEVPVFEGDGTFNITGESRFIHQLRYDFFDFNVLNRKEYYLQVEQQSYENPFGESESYLKLSGALTYDIMYKPAHSIRIRVFAAGFLINSQRNSSSFNSQLSRGSIALMHQAPNDYTYETFYLNRQQGNGPFTNQVNRVEGGFKDALGPSYNIGLSNDFAASIGLQFDLPMNLPSWFKLKPYFDLGYYRTKSTLNDPLAGKTIYSGGLMLSYLDSSLEIYFPLFSSSEINDVYNQLGENIFQRISFSIDLHRLNPWDLIDDLNF